MVNPQEKKKKADPFTQTLNSQRYVGNARQRAAEVLDKKKKHVYYLCVAAVLSGVHLTGLTLVKIIISVLWEL